MTSGVLVKQAGKPFVLAAGIPGPRGPQGPSGSGDDDVYAKRVDFVGDTVIDRGEAAVGATTSSGVWRVRRITLASDGDVTEEWAGGSAEFNQVWDNRASLMYL